MSLTLHSEPIAEHDGLPAIGLRRFVIRDSAGEPVEVEFMAWGQIGAEVAGLFPGAVEVAGERTDGEMILRNDAVLDAGGEYLLLVVRCDTAVRDG